MNQSIKLSWTGYCRIGCFAMILLVSCHGGRNKKDEERDDLMQKAPYASLTDSIRQSAPGDVAGLYLRRGDRLSQNNLHEIAVNDYKRSWELQPDEETGLHYASTLSILGRIDDAIQVLQDGLKKFPANSSFARLLGDLYAQSGRMREAEGLYDTLLHADSLNFEAWYEKGLLLEEAKDTAGAIDALKKAYGLQPVNTYALELAHLYAEKGNAIALQLCDASLQKDSTGTLLDPLFIKGIYYANTLQYTKAVAWFDSCIRRDWKFTDAYLEKGIALFHEKKYEEAMTTFQLTVSVSNTYPDGYFWLGRCYEVMGKKEEAVIYYQQAVALDKDFVEAKERISRLKTPG